jgi:hypothetical protein
MRGVRPKHHTHAHLAKLVRPFVDCRVDACAAPTVALPGPQLPEMG